MDIPGVFWFQRWCLVYGTAWYHDVPRNSDERCLILGTNVLLVIFIHLVLGSRFSDSSKFINYICIYVLYIYNIYIYIHGIRSFDWLGYVWLRPLSLLFAHPEPCLWFRPQTSCPLASGCLCLIDKTPLSWTCSFLVSCQSCVSCFFNLFG
jgi:hypothetical protein